MKSKPAKSAKLPVKMTPYQRESLVKYVNLKDAVERRIKVAGDGPQVIEFSKRDIEHTFDGVSLAAYYTRSPHQQRLVAVRKKLDDILQGIQAEEFGFIAPQVQSQTATQTGLLFQFKILLLGIYPSIWRRIQVENGTLDRLHDQIQAAMGWEDCHLHEFIIDGDRYGMPEADVPYDETAFMLSDVVPEVGKRFRFIYEYDFGDGWQHEILFEGFPPKHEGKRYPVCLDGEQACPPEDCGGPWGYRRLLDYLDDPAEYDDYFEMFEGFDPEEFSAEQVTKAMAKMKAFSDKRFSR